MSKKKMEIKLNVIEDDEFRETIKELVKTQVVAISREEFSQITKDALSGRMQKEFKKFNYGEEIRNVIRQCIYNSIPSPYRDFNSQVKEAIRDCVKEVLTEKMKNMEW
jgi:uncharacterized membrane-anchored protein YjiN (DUF445 family)